MMKDNSTMTFPFFSSIIKTKIAFYVQHRSISTNRKRSYLKYIMYVYILKLKFD